MRGLKITRTKVGVGSAIAVAAAGGIVAYAFWTTGGAGSGSASTGTPSSNLTINASETAPLVLNGTAGAVTLSVTNPNNYSVDLAGDTASIVSGSIKCGSTSVPDTWFTLSPSKIGGSSVIAAGASNSPVSDSGLTLALNDDPSNDQDACQGASVTFSLHVASETGH